MSGPFSLHKKNTLENWVLFLVFLGSFLFFIIQPPLYSPDTYSYLRADISRFPGYIIYLRSLQYVFGSNLGIAAVAGHLLFGFIAIYILFKNCSSFFKLSVFFRAILIGVLLFPYFYPIEIAVNLTSEGIAYPLYLLFISFTIDFIYRNQDGKIFHLCIAFIVLVLTRGQFIVAAPIVALLYLLKMKRDVLKRKYLLYLIIFLVLPVITGTLDRTYRKVFYGFFETTPYSYVNAITLPLFVSEKENAGYIKNKDHRNIFLLSHHRIDSMGLLNSKIKGSYKAKYKVFHNNFPKICNQNIHDYGKAYYRDIGVIPPMDSFKIEEACKKMFPVLISKNFKEWSAIYLTGIIHGFKSVFILFFVIVLAVVSFWRTIKRFRPKSSFIFFATLLILSNAMVVGIASHSIMRYLFYNYFLGLLIIIILLKKILPEHES